MKPEVNIIITTYNRAALLPRSVESVLSQDYPNLFIIVVDDGSTDNTAAYLNTLEGKPQIKTIVRHPENLGQTIAKNAGLNALSPTAKYFGIFDSDDIMLPGAISSLVAEFERLGNTVSQIFGLCEGTITKALTGEFDGESPYVTFEDAIAARFRGEYWQLVRTDLMDGLRFDERAAGGLSLVWHSLLKIAPGYITDTLVRIYDQAPPDRLTIPTFNEQRSRKKMYTYISYLDAFKSDLLQIKPERFGEMSLDAARWAKLAGEQKMSMQLALQAFRKTSFQQCLSVTTQTLLPRKVLRWLKEKKYSQATAASKI